MHNTPETNLNTSNGQITNNQTQIPNQNFGQQPINNQQVNQNIQNQAIINQNNPTVEMMQTMPTVNQTQENFINNIQNENQNKKEKKESGTNYLFIIILFTIIFAAILFLFPYLLKHLNF